MSQAPSDFSTPLSLLQRLRQPDDAAAWDWFARLYAPLLFYWAKRTGLQESDAADLVQEVFALLIRKLPEFRYEQGGSFRGWLRTVLLNKWRELNRRRNSPIRAAAVVEDLVDPGTEGLDGTSYQDELVSRALDMLQPDFHPATWEAFWQTTALGRPAPIVASELGLSPNAIRIAKFRVLKRLRLELDGLLN